MGWELSLRCRTQEAIAAVERAALETMADGSRGLGLVLTTDNGTQFTSARFVDTSSRLAAPIAALLTTTPKAMG